MSFYGKGSNCSVYIIDCCIFSVNYFPGVSYYYGMGGDVKVDVCKRRDKHVVTNRYASDENCVRSDPHIVSDGRSAFATPSVFLPDGDTRGDINVLAKLGASVDNYSAEMTYIKSFAYLGGVGYLYVRLFR